MKKILFTLLTVLLAGLAAQAATDYGFSVAGTTVTSDNCNNIVNNYITSGTVYYVPSSNTLYMNNVTINMTGDYNRVINNLECSGLKVQFSGTCNLYARDAAVIRIRKNTTLSAPSALTVVNITGVNDVGIWMATTNDYKLTISGPGTFRISSTAKPAIEDADDGSGTQLDLPHEVVMENVIAELSSSQDNVVRRFWFTFKAGSSVRFKATHNSSKSVITQTAFAYEGNETILEPYGAYYSGNTVYDSNGSRVYNEDVYVSDDYVAIINATNFPDANFRNRMLSLIPKGYITSAHVNAYDYLNLSSSNISNLKGIEYFTNLETLHIQYNNLTSVDLSHNTKLKTLNCYNNQLTSLNLNNHSNLEALDCSNNKLTSLNVNNKSNLTTLNCSNNTLLTTLACIRNNLTTLNVTGCTALTDLRCYENANLATITGLATCKAIIYLDCEDCAITNLSAVQSMSNIEKLYARNNKLTTLDVSQLWYLNTLRVSGNTLLTNLKCYYCDLTNLQVTGCSSLTYIDCTYNKLTSLDVTGCTALNHLEIYFNKISGSGMTTLVNSLPTRSASNQGVMYAIHINDNNSMTAAQFTTARNKYWLPKKYNGSAWVDLTASTRGDVNGTGNVNMDDLTALINYLLTGNSTGINMANAASCDSPSSTVVNMDDLTALINYLLTNTWSN